MSFIVEDTGGNFERVPAGVHLARCYRIVDLGTQETTYLGQKKFSHKIMIGWEIHATDDNDQPLLMRDGRPFAIFKNYTLSWAETANLRNDLQDWRGKPFDASEMKRFDLKNVLGAWCMLNIIDHEGKNGKTYSNVRTITPVPPQMKKAGLPDAVNQNELFSLADPDMHVFANFSDNLKAKIQSSPEWKKLGLEDDGGFSTPSDDPNAAAKEAAYDDKDDIPF